MRLYHRRKEMHELLANNNFNVPDYQLKGRWPSESELICVLKELIWFELTQNFVSWAHLCPTISKAALQSNRLIIKQLTGLLAWMLHYTRRVSVVDNVSERGSTFAVYSLHSPVCHTPQLNSTTNPKDQCVNSASSYVFNQTIGPQLFISKTNIKLSSVFSYKFTQFCLGCNLLLFCIFDWCIILYYIALYWKS